MHIKYFDKIAHKYLSTTKVNKKKYNSKFELKQKSKTQEYRLNIVHFYANTTNAIVWS